MAKATKTTKKKTAAKKRAGREVTYAAWCQVRVSADLARAVAQLPQGERTRVVRDALTAACREYRIPLRPRDPRQTSLRGVS